MYKVFGFIFIICLVEIIIGMVYPKAVILWGTPNKRTRKQVIKYYGIALVISLILGSITVPKPKQNTKDNPQTTSSKITVKNNG